MCASVQPLTSRRVRSVFKKSEPLREKGYQDGRRPVPTTLAAGVLLEIVAKRIGHRRWRLTVDRYGHMLPEANVAAADAVDACLSTPGGAAGTGGAAPSWPAAPRALIPRTACIPLALRWMSAIVSAKAEPPPGLRRGGSL